jgi:phosphoserine phosphatase
MHFFDLDGTLIRGNCSFSFGVFLFKKRKISFFKALVLLTVYIGYKGGLITLETLHKLCFTLLFKGEKKEEYEAFAFEFVEGYSKADFNPLFWKVKGLKFICSSSPDLLVSFFAKKLQVDGAIGTSYEVDRNGAFLKVAFVVDGKRKALFLKEKRQRGEKSIAYSDSLEDKLFLEEADEAHFIR